jgi:hypothetical protein
MTDNPAVAPPPPKAFRLYGTPFVAGHLLTIKQQNLRDDAAGHPDDLANPVRVGAVATAIMYHARQAHGAAGLPVACAGVAPPEGDRARAWFIIGEGLGDETLYGVTAALYIFFAQQQVRRLELLVPQKAFTTIRWAREAGFKLDDPHVADLNGQPYALLMFAPALPRVLSLADEAIAGAVAAEDHGTAAKLRESKGDLLETMAKMRRAVPVAGPV